MQPVNCEIIRDLLPLYADDSLSESGCELVRNHLKSCEECEKLYKYMSTDIRIPKDRVDPSQSLRDFKRKARKTMIELHPVNETAYISTDGFSFEDMEELILLWEKK